MRPGSAEIIEHYRKLAEQELPLTPDPDDPIPMLPGQDNALRKIEMNDMANLDRAIDRILSDEGAEYIQKRIAELEKELGKLKHLQRALQRNSPSGRKGQTMNFTINPEIEEGIVCYVRKNGPSLPGEIAKAINVGPINIGRIVAASDRLTKQGAKVVLAKS